MKKRSIQCLTLRMSMVFMLLMMMSAHALAYDAAMAGNWMDQFAAALQSVPPMNDAAQTADPARAGEYLIEYEFGTVLAKVANNPSAEDILEIDVRTSQVTDCRGVRVGMELDAALEGISPVISGTQLYVLNTSEPEYGWSWAYLSDDGIYGVEYIAYGGDEAGMMEYTLTYVIGDDGISAIRMKAADATILQARDGYQTAQELAARQDEAPYVSGNTMPSYEAEDLQVNGYACLGKPVANLIACLGEPQEVQALAQGSGRVLVYDGAAVRLMLDEKTGEEIVRGVSVSSPSFTGPRRLMVGMRVQEAAALARCDVDLFSRGGTLYLEGEAQGEAPYGEMTAERGGENLLTYACVDERGEIVLLQIGVMDETVAYWQIAYEADAKDGV
ncbi:MAG: hypothetical protein IJB85_08705 [Clostridia bacterium]|nr:hypothetical protein [Clostridia bacterium]